MMKKIVTDVLNKTIKTDLNFVTLSVVDGEFQYTINRSFLTAFGFGEKFDSVNQAGKTVLVSCREKCFYQGEFSYCTYPFMITADGFGVYLDVLVPSTFDLTYPKKVVIKLRPDVHNDIGTMYYFEGTPEDILKQFVAVRGPSHLFPKEVLGCWMSSNRWHTDEEIYEQLAFLKQTKIPHNVMVAECWADEQTMYNFSGQDYQDIPGNKHQSYKNFSAVPNARFRDPKKMVHDIHRAGLKFILWDVPTLYVDDKHTQYKGYSQRKIDNAYAVKNREAVMMPDGTPYIIPQGNWWYGSYIPDFSNPKAVKHWFGHRKYLADIHVDGYKTDGGEFVHDSKAVFHNGLTGYEMKNRYPDLYLKSYLENTMKDPILYSRAGYSEIAKYSILWGGDQLSTWDEYRSMIKAMLSSSFSGIPYWGFDIAGFSGPLPSKTLYLRSVQFASLIPIMQWHSDPVANGGWDTTRAWPINDRSPWNLAGFYKDASMMKKVAPYFHLHYNFIPYMYDLALRSTKNGTPIVSHLAYHFPHDIKTYGIEDEFMLGDAVLSVPIVDDYVKTRRFYLPEGNWYRLGDTQEYAGGKYYEFPITDESFIAFIRKNKAIAVNLDHSRQFAKGMNNRVHHYKNLTFIYSGVGSYSFKDESGEEIAFTFGEGKVHFTKKSAVTEVTVVDYSKEGANLWPKNLMKD